jgi:hypothetical protein
MQKNDLKILLSLLQNLLSLMMVIYKKPQLTPYLTMKYWIFSPKIENEARKSMSITSTQYCTTSSTNGKKKEKNSNKD